MKVEKPVPYVDKGNLIRQQWMLNKRKNPMRSGLNSIKMNPYSLLKMARAKACRNVTMPFNDIDFY